MTRPSRNDWSLTFAERFWVAPMKSQPGVWVVKFKCPTDDMIYFLHMFDNQETAFKYKLWCITMPHGTSYWR